MREVITYECAHCDKQWDNGGWRREQTQGFPHYSGRTPTLCGVYDEQHTPALYIAVQP